MKIFRNIFVVIGALWLLLSCWADKGERLQQLEMLEQMNRADSVMNNDSLAEDLVSFFDKHGTPNERMRAHYILGRTYFDLGELPRALETYLEAADCADTTASDCDYKTLGRIHAQSAKLYHFQIQPYSQISELRKAEYFFYKANDSILAIECFAQQADAYNYLKKYDSVIIIRENASMMYLKANKPERSALSLGGAITSLLRKNNIMKAKRFIDIYEKNSGSIDSNGNVVSGRKIYYFIKGKYYLEVGKTDSAEIMFRKLINEATTLNHLIAGSKGLQEVYEHKRNTDSVAKYAKLGYELNDSAYSLSEMSNIQKLKALYDYNHNKLLAEQSERRAERAMITTFIIVITFVFFVILCFFLISNRMKSKNIELNRYLKDLDDLEKAQTELMIICSEDKVSTSEYYVTKSREIKETLDRVASHKKNVSRLKYTLEERLNSSPIVLRLRKQTEANPYKRASQEDMKALRNLINVEIPHFYSLLNTPKYTLSPNEYDVTLLLRVHFSPMEIHKLTGISPSYISNMRSRLLTKVYGVEGSPKDYDKKILSIK